MASPHRLIMLIERKSTLHTGTVVNEKTRTLAEQLRPVPSTACSREFD
jgi:hypothetical protein